jgi:hypothetical protein
MADADNNANVEIERTPNLSERKDKLKGDIEKPKYGKARTFFREKVKPYLIAGAAIASIGAGVLGYDYFTKRQNYPERNILFRASLVDYVAGNKEKKAAPKADREAIAKFYEGGEGESKVGNNLFETSRELRGDIDYFNMWDGDQTRIANSSQKPEKFQARWYNPRGFFNFREQFAKIREELPQGMPQTYMVYKFAPERGFTEMDSDVIEYGIERGLRENEPGIIETAKKGKEEAQIVRVMCNRLVESRNLIGWFKGKEFRAGTSLADYMKCPENKELALEFFKKTKLLDSQENTSEAYRERLVKEIMGIEERMKKQTIYTTYEDGFFKVLPQESTVYLGEDPSIAQRLMWWAGFGRAGHNILRVENQWDLIPGRWPLLNEKSWGFGENTIYPFDKYNNGGYTIKDKFGTIAQIEIKDFVFKYGQNVLYDYYADLNGDGKIDRNKELIGRVLCATTHDEKVELEKIAKGLKPESDLTFTINYSFFSPDKDLEKGKEYFKLCAYVESLMPDQIHRGNGEHSLLGYVNDQRSDILLFIDPCVENMSRALTQESTLAAKYDIIKLLNATKRPYTRDLAKLYHAESAVNGEFQTSELTRERIYFPWGALSPLAILAGAGYFHARRKNKDAKYKKKLKLTR